MSGASPRVIAAIPCYNEARFIGDIVTRVKRFVPDVVVVDDGSVDGTSEVARQAGATVIAHSTQRGAGAATRSAFLAARERDADILVTLDGDGQHAPEDLPAVLAPALNGEADIVVGSRFLFPGYVVPAYRKFGIDVITWLFNVGAMPKVSDAQSCYRTYTRKAFGSLIPTEHGFGFSVQLLVEARRLGLRIVEVPIACIYHEHGSTKNPIIHGLGVALTVARLRLRGMLSK
ncbi:MAG: glycosyltransferase family 2 protein [Chloroflexota bacterium]